MMKKRGLVKMTATSARQGSGGLRTMNTLVEPEDYDVSFTVEERRKLHNWCVARKLIFADIPRAIKGRNKAAIRSRGKGR